MTVEEIEIIVTARMEEVMKEVKKLEPALKEMAKKVKESMQNVDTKQMTDKVNQAVQFVKKKISDLRKSSENNKIKLTINNQEAQKQISQIQRQIDSLQEKINARQMKLNVITPRLDEITAQTIKTVAPSGVSPDNPAIQQTINNSLNRNKEYTSLIAQEEKMTQEIAMYNKQLSESRNKMSQLKQEIEQIGTSQNKLAIFFSGFKGKLEQAKGSIGNFKGIFQQMPKITQNITNNIKGMGKSLKSGLGHVLKYAGALFSLRGIYSVLSSSAQSWLSSQNVGAQQLSANIDYMKNAMGSVLAPVIQFVTNLVYQLMKAIQSVVYALFRVNIFANASAKSMGSVAGNTKKATKETKQLAGIHDEINNVQTQDNSDSGSGSGGATPSFDLSGVDSQLSPLAQKLHDFFKPLKESWDNYGTQVILAFKNALNGIGQTISAMWGSIETIITNGTVYSIIANILNSIGEIGKAWANAWNNDSNGTEIIQGIANMINDLTNAILNLVSSTGFQSFLHGIITAFSGIVQFLEPIISGFLQMSEIIIEIVMSTIGDLLTLIGDSLQSIGQNETAVNILKAIGEAIAIVVAGIIAWNAVQLILNGLMGLFAILTSPITLTILAIVAAITAIILIIKNWGAISEWFGELWQKITDKIKEIWENIKQFFINLWENIINKIKEVWNGIKDFFSNIWNGIKNTASTVFNAIATFFSNIWNGIKNVVSSVWNAITTTISNVINGIKNTISNVLNAISSIWNNIWNGLKTTVSNIFNAIWGAIKGVINSILGGIEGMANGVIKGINFVIRALNKLKIDIPDWVPMFGGKTFGFNLSTLNEISMPRLAKGGVLYEETAFIGGEYSGARTNPEIVTPESKMEEVFDRVMSRYITDNDKTIYLTVNVGNRKLGQILLEDLRDKKRQSGKDIEALVGG